MRQKLTSALLADIKEAHKKPRLVENILREYFTFSNDPLAVAFRERIENVKVEQSNADDDGKE